MAREHWKDWASRCNSSERQRSRTPMKMAGEFDVIGDQQVQIEV